ncbi:Peroxisomal adenine nucleotide transporter 1 [Lecanosticta acicola]|uniref:Peroxisomal adenine nucleotide transporter 1 n=1 Tax=Lecanosticta acicola TaxID=111012 RepID=A0AAI8YWX8_9PEZI|nr:Peroxisomal adenine nucleotide transporter 1 [Lecanosticta acicola]
MAPAPSKQELPPWGVALAGSAGALVANAMVYPLDIVKTRLQVQVKRNEKDTHVDHDSHVHYEGTLHAIQHIVQEEGMHGLFQGMTGNLLGVVSTNFAYFYWYGFIRTLYHKRIAKSDAPAGTLVELSLGAFAGALAQIFTIPISVITTRQQTQRKDERKNMFATAKEIVDGPEGVAGLWRGIKASMVLVVNPSITYGAYERLRTLLFPGKTSLAPHESFLLGALSKMMATVATQPLIIAKVGLQGNPPPQRNGKPFKSFVEVMQFVLERDGFLGLYKGIGPQLLKGFLVQGILMMTKERVELLFVLLFRAVRKMRREQLDKLAKITADSIDRAKQTAPK